jgi:hypothetical protein
MAHGMRMDSGNLAVVAVRPVPGLIAGQLSATDMQAVGDWIALNKAAIVDHWDGQIDGAQLVQRLQPLSPAVPP